jgi:hypothetical protein
VKQKKIVFIYRKNKMYLGSTLMRSVHLRHIITPHLPDNYQTELSAVPTGFFKYRQSIWASKQSFGSILFFTKDTLRELSPSVISILKKNNCYICVDYVDSDLNKIHEKYVDVHIASSFKAIREIENLKKKRMDSKIQFDGIIRILHHNVDYRIYDISPSQDNNLNIAYVGNKDRLFLPKELQKKVCILDAAKAHKFNRSIKHIHKYNMHYCVSPPGITSQEIVVKPFTKGFTAAVLKANVIINREADDAEELLGSDYPYFVDSHDTNDVSACLDKAFDTFQSSEWKLASERMNYLKSLVAPSSLANQMIEIVEEINS